MILLGIGLGLGLGSDLRVRVRISIQGQLENGLKKSRDSRV